jgi:hypothetical protein
LYRALEEKMAQRRDFGQVREAHGKVPPPPVRLSRKYIEDVARLLFVGAATSAHVVELLREGKEYALEILRARDKMTIKSTLDRLDVRPP